MRTAMVMGMATLMLGMSAQAHFVFLRFADTIVEMGFAEAPAEETPRDLQERVMPAKVRTASGEVLEFTSAEHALEAPVADDVDLAAGSLEYGVLDRSAQDRGVFMLYYHAKGVRDGAKAGENAGLPVEVIGRLNGAELEIEVLHEGKPAAMAELTISQEGGAEDIELDTDEAGKAKVTLENSGLVGVRAMVREDKAGEHDGTAYTLVRHYSTLTFPFSAP